MIKYQIIFIYILIDITHFKTVYLFQKNHPSLKIYSKKCLNIYILIYLVNYCLYF